MVFAIDKALGRAGLLAWIIEKMWRWVDGELESCISRDELLTNISLFWFTQSITSSMRLYREAIGPHSTAMPDILKHRCVVSAIPPHCAALYTGISPLASLLRA